MSVASEVEFKGKGQALRLGIQQELGGGPLTIFGTAAQKHNLSIREVTAGVLTKLAEEFPNLEFQLRTSLSKREINEKLSGFDQRLSRALFVESASIRPDGGITEAKDRHRKWRIVLVGESKHQGNDVEKIVAGILQAVKKDQPFIEKAYLLAKRISVLSDDDYLLLDTDHISLSTSNKKLSNYIETAVEVIEIIDKFGVTNSDINPLKIRVFREHILFFMANVLLSNAGLDRVSLNLINSIMNTKFNFMNKSHYRHYTNDNEKNIMKSSYFNLLTSDIAPQFHFAL